MTCAKGYDFIKGATIRLPSCDSKLSSDEEPLDIVRPNQRAAALVARHLRVLETLRSEPTRPAVTGRR